MTTKTETQTEAQVETQIEPMESDKIGRLEKASAIISNKCKWSAAAGFIPVPYLDLAGLAAVQVKMVSDLADLYGKTVKQEAIKTTVATLLGTLTTAGLAAPVAFSTAKVIPGLGSVAGGVSMGALGAAASYAVGKVFVNHFEGGGTLANFDVDKIKDDLKSAFTSKSAKKV
ncbi:MAG: DUF697 domain-containing protein [Pseudohongiella sp.]|nr:DUF697 domain-containing protein [Pseudohongiella sp.]MDO9520176.1 DUF697 domain-containing protein [Pseudohongiella sp.]MDP2125951.1 DUF697 domain-containing protein [Pseudohongiella sp.]